MLAGAVLGAGAGMILWFFGEVLIAQFDVIEPPHVSFNWLWGTMASCAIVGACLA